MMLESEVERHPVYVNEQELAMLTVGLELVKTHQLFPDHAQVRQDLINRLYRLLVP